MNIILQGVVGSTAYGLARQGSDIDTLGVWLEPTESILGLDWNWRKATRVKNDPDSTHHELGKYINLALSCNPTLMDLLWLDDYTIMTDLGERLISHRDDFLHETGVRNAYTGYAKHQITKLARRGDSFDSDTKNRTAKHARHTLRLIRQGVEILTTGKLTVKVPNPEEYWAFDEMTPQEMLERLEAEIGSIDDVETILSDNRDWRTKKMNYWLIKARIENLNV